MYRYSQLRSPPGGFRQRGRRRRHDRAGRGVGQRLQGQRASVDVRLPRVVRNLGRAQPVAPEIDGGVQGAERLVLAGWNLRVTPGQDHVGRLALGECGPAVAAGPEHAKPDAARELEFHLRVLRGGRHGVVPVALVGPGAAGSPVVEHRGTVLRDLSAAADACRDPDKSADRAGIRRGPVVLRAPRRVFDRADGQEVLHDQPPRRGLPGSFQHHRARDVPALLRHLRGGGAEPEVTGAPVQQRPEHARGVRAGQAQPLDGAVGRDQATLLAIGQQPVLGNRRKRAHRCLLHLAFKTVCADSEADNATITTDVRRVVARKGVNLSRPGGAYRRTAPYSRPDHPWRPAWRSS